MNIKKRPLALSKAAVQLHKGNFKHQGQNPHHQ